MIAPIPGWTFAAEGEALVLTPKAHDVPGVIRYVERKRPLLAFDDLVLAEAAAAGFPVDAVEDVELLVTDEGEYGLVFNLRGAAMQRTVACVLGDDFYASISGEPRRAEHAALFAATVRSLALRDCHMQAVRRRRFLFDPPAGWQPSPAGLFHTIWTREHEEGGGAITVYPALPLSAGDIVESLVRQSADGFTVDRSSGPIAASSAAGLSGDLLELVGGRGATTACRDLAVLQDDRFAYAVCLDSPATSHPRNRAAFAAVVASIQPIPRPRGARAFAANTSVDAVSHWAA